MAEQLQVATAETPAVGTPPLETPAQEVKEPEVKEPEVEEAVKAAEETPEQKQEREKDFMIPKYRFDAVRARERQLVEEMSQLKEQLVQQGATKQQATQVTEQVADKAAGDDALAADINSLSTQHAEAIFNGDTGKAAKLQAALMDRVIKNQVPQQTVNQDDIVNAALNRFEVSRVAEQLETLYPQLDKASDLFDADLNKDILDVYEGLAMKGEAPAAALSRAADLVLAAKGVTGVNGKGAPRGLTDKVAAANAPGALSPDIGSSTGGESGAKVENMSVDEWGALPDSARNKLLGIG